MSDPIVPQEGSAVFGSGRRSHRRSPSANNLLYWFCFVLGSLLISGIVGETAVRSLLDTQYHVWPPGMQYVFTPSPQAVPGVNGASHFVINRDGMRGDPLPAKGTYKILAIGGSTTECLYLDETEAWPHLLQEALGEQGRVWVGNVGKSGLSTRHHIVQVEHLTRQYPGIDAMILLIGANDFLQRLGKGTGYRPFPGIDALPLEDYEALMSEAFFTWPGSNHREPFHKRLAMWRVTREFKYRYLSYTGKQLLQDEDGSIFSKWRAHRRSAPQFRTTLPDLSAALQEYAGNIRAIVRIGAKQGVRVILSTQPFLWRADLLPQDRDLLWLGGVGKYQEEPGHEYYSAAALADGMNQYNQRLLQLCRDEHVECVDLEAVVPKERRMFYDDAHFTEAGSRQVAETFSRYLRSKPPFLRET